MPRQARMYLPEVPCHIVTRGNNRKPCFFAEADYAFYLRCLALACEKYKVSVHAYVLMTNHIHLLLTPQNKDGISSVMQSIGRRYVQYVNKTYSRCGTLFESRHKASLVSTEDHLLAVYRYIELNPVRAGMIEHPVEYRWSSYACNACGQPDGVVTPHEVYTRLGNETDRMENYRELFKTALSKQQLDNIRNALQGSLPLGNTKFKQHIESALGRRIGSMQRGRPRKKPK